MKAGGLLRPGMHEAPRPLKWKAGRGGSDGLSSCREQSGSPGCQAGKALHLDVNTDLVGQLESEETSEPSSSCLRKSPWGPSLHPSPLTPTSRSVRRRTARGCPGGGPLPSRPCPCSSVLSQAAARLHVFPGGLLGYGWPQRTRSSTLARTRLHNFP